MPRRIEIPITAGRYSVAFPQKCTYCAAPSEKEVRVLAVRSSSRSRTSASFHVPYCARHAGVARRNSLILYAILALCILCACSVQTVLMYALNAQETLMICLLGPAAALIVAFGAWFLIRNILARRFPTIADTANGLGLTIILGTEYISFEFTNPQVAEEFARLNAATGNNSAHA